jgi:membrane-associated phospholipid phosphatase
MARPRALRKINSSRAIAGWVMHSIPKRASSDRVGWLVIAAILAAIGAAELNAPLAIVPASLTGLALACAALTAVACFYRTVRPREELAISCIALVQALLFSAAGSILSYLLARRGGAPWDSTLQAWDGAIGFDWLAYVRFVDAQAAVATVLRLAYASLIPQVIVIILALGFRGRFDQLRSFVLAAMLSGLAAILLSPLFPAFGYYVHLGIGAGELRHVDPWAGYVHVADLTALRSGHMAALDLATMQGIITFPSYHAALATVTAWGFWNSRLKIVGWGGSSVALLTIVATPVDGGHYLVDVIAGVALALASIAAAKRLIYLRPALPSLTASPFRRLRAASAR